MSEPPRRACSPFSDDMDGLRKVPHQSAQPGDAGRASGQSRLPLSRIRSAPTTASGRHNQCAAEGVPRPLRFRIRVLEFHRLLPKAGALTRRCFTVLANYERGATSCCRRWDQSVAPTIRPFCDLAEDRCRVAGADSWNGMRGAAPSSQEDGKKEKSSGHRRPRQAAIGKRTGGCAGWALGVDYEMAARNVDFLRDLSSKIVRHRRHPAGRLQPTNCSSTIRARRFPNRKATGLSVDEWLT